MAAPPRSSAPWLDKLRGPLARLRRLTSALALLSAVVLLLALFGLLPTHPPEPPVRVKYDPAQAVDPPRPLTDRAAVLPAHRLLSWSFPVCPAPERGARMYRLPLRSGSSSYALFCQGEYVLLDLDLAADRPRVTRLGRFPQRGELPGGAAALDLDGDGALDLGRGVAPREGIVHRPPAGLYWLRGRPLGGYDPARALIEMPMVAALAAELDGRPPSELVALTRGDVAAQRPGELWVFRGGTSPTRAAVLPVALAPGDLVLGAEGEAERDLWVLSQQPGSLVRLRFARAPESWSSAARETQPLPGALAFVGSGGAKVYARNAQRVFAVEEGPGAVPTPLTEPVDLGPAVWLERAGQRRLLTARGDGFALIADGAREGRVRALPSGKVVLDVARASAADGADRGVLLLRSDEQPPVLALVVLPAELRDETTEIELRTGELEVAPAEARVPLE